MKSYAFILTLALLLVSCSNPESKAKKAIKEELKLTLHNYKSYEPVQFGKLEVASSKFDDIPEVKLYLDRSEAFLSKAQENSNTADIYDNEYSRTQYWRYMNLSRALLDSARSILNKVDSIKLHFVSKTIGWQMTHTFRANSLGGNLGIHNYLFTMNPELSKVIKSEDLSAN
jgi:hypothetical protein